jgi:hypothetical protein
MARSKKSEPPATPQGDAPAAPASPPPPDPPPAKHGPAGPPRTLYGFASLRAVMNLSAAVPMEQVCQEAALELARLRAALSPRFRTVNLDY